MHVENQSPQTNPKFYNETLKIKRKGFHLILLKNPKAKIEVAAMEMKVSVVDADEVVGGGL